MDKFEPKETGLKRTVWLFEREILANLEKTDLKDHHKVLSFNIFSMEYELNPEFDNGRADAIVMRDTANHWLKMWFVAFQTCASEKMQSRQAEVDELQANLDRADEIATRENNRANKLQEDNTRTTILLGKTIMKKEALEASIEESLQKVVRIKESFNQGKIVNYVMFLDDLEEVLRGEHEA